MTALRLKKLETGHCEATVLGIYFYRSRGNATGSREPSGDDGYEAIRLTIAQRGYDLFGRRPPQPGSDIGTTQTLPSVRIRSRVIFKDARALRGRGARTTKAAML